MGDHPVIWTNPRYKARNVYFQFGHKAELLRSATFTGSFSTPSAGPARSRSRAAGACRRYRAAVSSQRRALSIILGRTALE
jgi:hypothetical protein